MDIRNFCFVSLGLDTPLLKVIRSEEGGKGDKGRIFHSLPEKWMNVDCLAQECRLFAKGMGEY